MWFPSYFFLPYWCSLCITSCNYVLIGLFIFLIYDCWSVLSCKLHKCRCTCKQIVLSTVISQLSNLHAVLFKNEISKSIGTWEGNWESIYSRLDSNLLVIWALDLVFSILRPRILCKTSCCLPYIYDIIGNIWSCGEMLCTYPIVFPSISKSIK